MDDNVVKLPTTYHRPRQLSGRQIWDAPEPSDAMVWEICPYLRDNERCQECPRWVEEPEFGSGIFQRGCFAIAAEACRIVMAMQKIEEQK